jgi:hypothetical protein
MNASSMRHENPPRLPPYLNVGNTHACSLDGEIQHRRNDGAQHVLRARRRTQSMVRVGGKDEGKEGIVPS